MPQGVTGIKPDQANTAGDARSPARGGGGHIIETRVSAICAGVAATLMPAASKAWILSIAARTLCKRLRARLPSARILVGLWQPDDAEFTARRMRLGKAGADETYPDLRRAAAAVVAFAACTLPPGTDMPAPPPP